MGMADWFKSKQREMERAYEEARWLRERYGPAAEHWCAVGIHAVTDGSQRRAIRRVQKALRHLA